MKIDKSMIIILLIIIASAGFSLIDFSPKNPVSIASWNLNIFGDKKADNESIMQQYHDIISKFDIIFLQEIRDADGSALMELCALFNESYNCLNSSRAGSTSSKEQYYLIYGKEFTLLNYTDYNIANITGFERPPIKADFSYNNINFTIYGIHIKPADAKNEIANLEDLITNEGKIIILGDLNADCSYYKKGDDFIDWHWAIDGDTTVSSSDCAYDNMIINEEFYKYFIQPGIFTQNITQFLSDHYLIYSIFDLS